MQPRITTKMKESNQDVVKTVRFIKRRCHIQINREFLSSASNEILQHLDIYQKQQSDATTKKTASLSLGEFPHATYHRDAHDPNIVVATLIPLRRICK